jgi:hypothetical protein
MANGFIDSDQHIEGSEGVHSNEPSGVEDHRPTHNGPFKEQESATCDQNLMSGTHNPGEFPSRTR